MGFRRLGILFLLLGCGALVSLGEAIAADQPGLPDQAKPLAGILVPVPKEIFRTLDRFQNVNWRVVQRPEVVYWKSQGEQEQIALLLGVVIAEGFIAMEAQDPQEVTDVGERVLTLARALGVEQTALRRSRSITDAAQARQWSAARKEWDNLLSDFEKGMIELKSEPLFHLVSLAGWLRGTEALSILVRQDYSADRANLLRQTPMVDYLDKQLRQTNESGRNHAMVAKMLQGLQEMRALIGSDRKTVSEKTVNEIANTCRGLVVAISQRSE